MTPHQNIIDRFDSLQALADAVSKASGKRVPKSTVQGWKESGFIPSWRQPHVLQAGASLEPPLSTKDFF